MTQRTCLCGLCGVNVVGLKCSPPEPAQAASPKRQASVYKTWKIRGVDIAPATLHGRKNLLLPAIKMTRVLLTGASGFIATHILDILFAHGHSVRITVRSEEKAQKIVSAYPEHADKLDYVIVPDIAAAGAFDKAVQSEPPFEAVLHTASPFHFRVTDIRKDLLDPAINGTTGILHAIKKYAPSVKRVVITSSFASIIDPTKGTRPGHVYSEADWNPVTIEEATRDPGTGYRASKTLAEKSAWNFVEDEKPNFEISTINPPLVFGPIKEYSSSSLDAINTSNEVFRNIVQGKYKEKLPPNGTYVWVDVRDVAAAHVAAFEKPEAAGKRFFIVEGSYFSNQQIADIIVKNFPEYKDQVPAQREANDGFNYKEGEIYTVDNSRSKQVLGLKYHTFEQSVVDTIKSLKALGL
ncbi:hypothetical protein FN846DRAFT_938130 [Sphaerosporella brunnea]|uniref:NAD-dependent epimerase/dehydratase domain-containing protein n=1 Tax=Sphaerosporella brunnea TaxID=1250544 RepID=A0A5J5F3W6_9PEZI|nr:hypothetical protein FN846DRAFT_938130 [Sphaerosporella brunnea]